MFDFEKSLAPGIPLDEAAAFFVKIKTAGWEDPPDETGELEGQFSAPVEQVMEAMRKVVNAKFRLMMAYCIYANSMRGLEQSDVARKFDHSFSWPAKTDAETLLRRLGALGGPIQLEDVEPPPASSDPIDIIKKMIRAEQECIADLRVLCEMVCGNPTKAEVERMMSSGQRSLDELWQLLPQEEHAPLIDVGGPGDDITPEAAPAEAAPAEEPAEAAPAEEPPAEEPPAEEPPEGEKVAKTLGEVEKETVEKFRESGGRAGARVGARKGGKRGLAYGALGGAVGGAAAGRKGGWKGALGAGALGALGGAGASGAVGAGVGRVKGKKRGEQIGERVGGAVNIRRRQMLRRRIAEALQQRKEQSKTSAEKKPPPTEAELKETGRQRGVASMAAEAQREKSRRGERFGETMGRLAGTVGGAAAGKKWGGKYGLPTGAALGFMGGGKAGKEVGTELDIRKAAMAMKMGLAKLAQEPGEMLGMPPPQAESPDTMPQHYLAAEQMAQQAQNANEAEFYRGKLQDAGQQTQVLQEQVQGMQQQLAQLEQQAAEFKPRSLPRCGWACSR
jgi:bacterioferritin (cytochrome b1)